MPFTPISDEEYQRIKGTSGFVPMGSNVEQTTQQSKQPGILSRVASGLKSSVSKRVNNLGSIIGKTEGGEQSKASGSVQVAGQIAGFGADVIGIGFTEALKGVLNASQIARNLVEEGDLADLKKRDADSAKIALSAFLNSDTGKDAVDAIQGGIAKWDDYKARKPVAAANIEAVLNVADFGANFIGAGMVGKAGKEVVGEGLEAGAKAGARALAEGGKAVEAIGGVAEKIAPTVKSVGTTLGENVRGIAGSITKAPGRLATNAEDLKLARLEIESLPTDTAKQAVRNGLEMKDAQLLTEDASTGTKGVWSKMLTAAEKFGKTRSAKDPALVGGAQVTQKLDELKKVVNEQGRKLGEVVKTIPEEKVKGIFDASIRRLREIPELEGITVSPKGILNFKGTKLSTSFTASDRKAIQEAWSSLYGRGGQDMHKLRQELFEVINKQARGSEGFTKTKDEAINAIRMGISDGLDTVSPGYKALNKLYAKAITPYERLEQYFKKLKDMGEDVLAERGASLLRNLSSRNVNAAQIRGVLQQVDDALKAFGYESDISLKQVEDFYDTLQRTFDITLAQSLAGQLRVGDIPMSAKGIVDKTLGAVVEKAGITSAVKQKALRDLLESIIEVK
jgi:hypothetical protein